MPYDLITMGRVGVDLYPEQIGVPLAEVRTFAKSLGGSPTNVAVAAARLGRSAAVITRVGADGFGPYVRQALRRFGVDDRFVILRRGEVQGDFGREEIRLEDLTSMMAGGEELARLAHVLDRAGADGGMR